LEAGTHRRMSEALVAALGERFAATTGSMGGPAIAIEMARGQPMSVIIGIPDEQACQTAQAILQNDHLKVEMTADVVGLELCSTLKNVYAIALGMCDGLVYGTNTKASLASLALAEMSRIAEALGGRRETAYGLAGLGDLITTGFSQHSRNRALGEKLAAGGWQEFLRTNTVEGVPACGAVGELIEPRGLTLPLFTMVHGVICHEQPAPEAMTRFLREFSYTGG
jgi:glycerol-3-phosphate dehydrogenase (NAD(P)+)